MSERVAAAGLPVLRPVFAYRDYLGAELRVDQTPRGSLLVTGSGVTLGRRDIPRLITALKRAVTERAVPR